ncbi:MAG: FecR domain-containing protein [Bryobacteraceae bacterium]|nr:FecR domain-containing protein [Bryobacteraceae bacterium]
MTRKLLAAAVVLQLTPLALLRAQTDGDDEGPGRGVARISVLNGDVSVRRSDTGDWVAAAINAPIIVPDTILTGAGSRAEVQLDHANLLRLAANTEVRFSELENNRYQLQISRGIITFSVLRDTRADVDLSTPNVSVRPARKGRYRVAVRDDGTTEITVRSGEAEVFTPRGAETLRAGRTMMVRGTASEPEFQLASAIPQDEWDRWNEERDKELSRSNVYRYVSSDIYGAEDLDPYGRWVYVPSYGWVWSPRVAPDWAPYRYGRWSWLDWYGWTWVSYDPWGWAPYHYGRWFHHGPYGWCWWPGGFRSRHYWRPALVGFFGWGGRSGFNIGVGFGWGHVGWVPLAPYERFHPWYGHRYYRGFRNSTYIDNSVNIVNNVNVTNVYRNASVGNGITAVNGANFGRGRVSNVYRGSEVDLRRVDLVRGQMPVVPHRESLSLSDRQARVQAGPAGRDQFATRRAARQAETVPFNQQQQGIERAARRALNQSDNPRLGASGAAVAESPRAGNSNASRGGTGDQTSRGWRREGDTPRGAEASAGASRSFDARGATRSSEPAAVSPRERSTSGGWRRFGDASQPEASTGSERSVSGRGAAGARVDRSTGGWPGRPAENAESSSGSGSAGAVERSTGGWRRFGEPARMSDTVRPESVERSGGSRSSSRTWDRTGNSDAGSSSGSLERRGRSEGFGETPSRVDRGGSYESVPSRPSIVRERSSSRSDRSSERFSGAAEPRGSVFGGSDSGSRSSPRSSGGGGFESGGGRSSGGGGWSGGATRSSGGGSSRSSGGGSWSGGGGSRSSSGGGGWSGGGRSGGGASPSGGGGRSSGSGGGGRSGRSR